MKKRISTLFLSCFLFSLLILPAGAAESPQEKQLNHNPREQKVAQILHISENDLAQYAKDGIYGPKLIKASIIAQLSHQEINQIIAQLKSGKTIAQLFDENHLSLVQFEAEQKKIRQEFKKEQIKECSTKLAKDLNLKSDDIVTYLESGLKAPQIIDAKIISDLSGKKLSIIIKTIETGKSTAQLIDDYNISVVKFQKAKQQLDLPYSSETKHGHHAPQHQPPHEKPCPNNF